MRSSSRAAALAASQSPATNIQTGAPYGAAGWLAPAAIYLGLLAAHAPLLRLPYYWDEAGYFIPAALDLSRHGWWIPHSTLANGHPPLVMAVLAAAWHLAGVSRLVTRATMAGFAAALVWGVYRLSAAAADGGGGRPAWASGAVAAALMAITPVCFAQSTLAQLDLPAAALVVWALVWRARGRAGGYALAATAAALTKETAILVPATLLVWDLAQHWRGRWRRDAHGTAAGAAAPPSGSGPAGRPAPGLLRRLAPHFVPALALALWFAYYHSVTGYWMGNAQFLSFNVGETRSAARFLMAFYLRVWQMAGYQGMILITALAFWGWRRGRRELGTAAPLRRELAALIAVYLLFHAAIGGAVLARYLLPAMALYLALIAPYLWRLPRPALCIALGAALLVSGWTWNPPYPFPYEDNLAYVTFVRLHQRAAAYLEAQGGTAPVVTAWPATNELTNPDLGYVRRPLRVVPVENFTVAGLAPGALAPGEWALLYSREYQPQHDWTHWVPYWRRWSGRYFHHQEPLTAEELLARIQARAVFRAAAGGQWVVVARR